MTTTIAVFASDYSVNSNDFDIVPWLVVWFICGLIGAAVGSGKGMGQAGFFLGLLLGPIGIIVVAVMKPSTLSRLQTRPEEAGWHDDPLGRFDKRWFDGSRWTQHVGRVETDGTRRQLEDPL